MAAYYNENDLAAAAWLNALIDMGMIADGVVDTRDIEDVRPRDLEGFTQCHFFAGIGVWSYALRNAGWPDDRPVWTGSCPCQPFSTAGQGEGFDDERHLWPAWHHLIRVGRPEVVFGEQVASPDGLTWLDLVSTDMDHEGYAFAAADTCAAGYGAPEIRSRLYFVADADNERLEGWQRVLQCSDQLAAWQDGVVGRLADPAQQLDYWRGDFRSRGRAQHPDCGSVSRLADAAGLGSEMAVLDGGRGGSASGEREADVAGGGGASRRPGPTNGFWRFADWLFCRDEGWRPVSPGTFPLAHGSAARVVRLRGYGNGLVEQQARGWIQAFLASEAENIGFQAYLAERLAA